MQIRRKNLFFFLCGKILFFVPHSNYKGNITKGILKNKENIDPGLFPYSDFLCIEIFKYTGKHSTFIILYPFFHIACYSRVTVHSSKTPFLIAV